MITTAFTCALATPLLGLLQEDWPQFRGPHGNGSTDPVPSDFEWDEDGPDVVWATPVGPGYGGTAIQGGEVVLLDRDPGGEDVLRVFDFETGEEKWSLAYEAPGRLNFPGSRSVPTVDEERIYTTNGFGRVTCFDREKEEIAWETDMEEIYGGLLPMFGWSASPLVVGDMVITTPLGEDVGLLALDKETGDEMWVTEGVGYSHSSPALLNLAGREQVVFLSTSYQTSGQDLAAPTTISAFDPEDGSLLWRTETTLTRLPIPAPIKIDDGRFFLTGGYRGGSTMMKIERDGRDYSFEELFHIERGAQVHQPLLHGDHLYVLVNENWNDSRARQSEGGLLCLDLAGEERWRTGASPFFGRGNAILAGDHLVIQDGHDGTLRIVKASPEGYQLVAEADVFGKGDRRDHQMWAPMALSGRRLVLRSQEELLCVEL